MADQFYHAQLVYRLWVPPAVVAFDRFLTRRSLRAGAACVLFVALQLAAIIYLGLFLCLLLSSYAAASLTTVRPATINSRILQAVARVSVNSSASISSRWRWSLIAAQ